jgi:hypothetical protein
MLIELAWFAAGCVAGGYFVHRGMRSAMKKELMKRPWTEEENEERSRMLAEAVHLSTQKGDPDAIRRSKELQRRLVANDVRRGK